MAEKNIQMQKKNADGSFDIYYPKTKAANVIAADGSNLESHLAEYAIQTAGGTANAIAITTGGDFKYTQGNKISFKAITNSTGAVTVNIDEKGAKTLKKLDGSNATVKSNKVYEIFYSTSDDCFFLLARAEGNAIAENVLAGKTFSNDDDTGISGAMANRGAVTNTITTQNGQYIIPQGYHNGSGKVTTTFANLIADNIKQYINIGGIIGNLVPKEYSEGTSQADQWGVINISGLSFTPSLVIYNYEYTNYGSWGLVTGNLFGISEVRNLRFNTGSLVNNAGHAIVANGFSLNTGETLRFKWKAIRI